MDENTDFVLALQLQQELNEEEIYPEVESLVLESNKNLSIVDPSWELIDPNPDIRALFLQFNTRFFWGRLLGIEVKWSPKMTLCAGLCVYEGRGGLCSVRLSLPLLKLRPRKDLVETLLHEMIHAYLFVTDNDKDHDGHGPEFHKHMHRINKESGTRISVYHNFHDEVDEYRQHWWRCNGPCQKRPPFFGYVRRAMNRAPSSRDIWWKDHERSCQGTFIKIKEPENYGKKKGEKKEKKVQDSKPGKGISAKNGDMRTFIENGNILGGNKVVTTSTTGSSGLKGNNFSIHVKPAAMLTKPVTTHGSLNGSNSMPEVSRSGQHTVDKEQENSTHIISFQERKFKFEDDYLTSDSDDELLFNFVESVEHNLEESKRKEGEKKKWKTDNSKAVGRNDLKYSETFKRVDNISTQKSNEQKSGDSDNSNSHILPDKYQIFKPNLSQSRNDNDDVKATLRRVWGEKNFNISNSDKSKVKNLEQFQNHARLQDNLKKRTASPFEGVTSPVKKKLKNSTSDSHKNKEDLSSDEEMSKIFEKIREKQLKRKQRMKTNIESQAETSDELDSNSFEKKELKFRTVSNKEQSLTNLGDVKDISHLVSHWDNSESSQFNVKSSSLRQTSLSDFYSDSLRQVSQSSASINSVKQESRSVSDLDRLTTCPVCNKSVLMNQINEHLDSCLT
ncbi:hypothetical protein CHS0354_042558 [Potamilus streckersoni]|uniref:Protein with SprT-like domain at the N terminus n=1 Tax=Potamilus streckersoni TaxID=2493646 RepID=A0AAE0TDT7_9BIVA|nr:hypothetical protein CHS0354_042558 [Potamilus streckersoni]